MEIINHYCHLRKTLGMSLDWVTPLFDLYGPVETFLHSRRFLFGSPFLRNKVWTPLPLHWSNSMFPTLFIRRKKSFTTSDPSPPGCVSKISNFETLDTKRDLHPPRPSNSTSSVPLVSHYDFWKGETEEGRTPKYSVRPFSHTFVIQTTLLSTHLPFNTLKRPRVSRRQRVFTLIYSTSRGDTVETPTHKTRPLPKINLGQNVGRQDTTR